MMASIGGQHRVTWTGTFLTEIGNRNAPYPRGQTQRLLCAFRGGKGDRERQKIDGRPWAPSTGTAAPLIQLARSDAR